jgi:hypothetical protein
VRFLQSFGYVYVLFCNILKKTPCVSPPLLLLAHSTFPMLDSKTCKRSVYGRKEKCLNSAMWFSRLEKGWLQWTGTKSTTGTFPETRSDYQMCCAIFSLKNRLCVSHPLFLLADNMLYMLEIHTLTWPAMSPPTMLESINTRSHVSCIQVTCYFNTLWRFSRLLYLFQTHLFTRNRKLQTHPWHEEPRRFCYATSWSRRGRIEYWSKTTQL